MYWIESQEKGATIATSIADPVASERGRTGTEGWDTFTIQGDSGGLEDGLGWLRFEMFRQGEQRAFNKKDVQLNGGPKRVLSVRNGDKNDTLWTTGRKRVELKGSMLLEVLLVWIFEGRFSRLTDFLLW